MTTLKLLTTAQVCRRLDVHGMTMNRALHRGVVHPDATAGKYRLFNETRLPEIRQALGLMPR